MMRSERKAEAADSSPSSSNGDARFLAFFENTIVGIEQVDADGRLIEVNPRLCEMLGYERDELLAMRYDQITHPLDLAAERANIQSLEDGEASSYRMKKRCLRRDGSSVWVEISSSAVRDGDGRCLYRASVIQDISDRKRESEEAARYKTLFAQSPFSVVLIDPTDGKLIDFNNHAHQSLGYSRREFAELSVMDVKAGVSREGNEARMAKILATGMGQYDARHRTKSGELRDVMVTSRPIQIEGLWLLQSVWQDVTSIRRATEDKARNHALVRQILNGSPLPMGIVELDEDDADVLHVYDNPATCRFFGLPVGATSGRRDGADLGVSPSTLQSWIAAYRASQRLGQPVHFEDCHEHDGTMRWQGVVVSFIGTESNGRDRFCYISEDITERKQDEQEILRLNQILERRATELSTLFEVLPVGIGIADDAACRSIRVNPSLAEMLRIPLGVNASLTAPEDERPRTFKAYRDGRELPDEELPMQISASQGVVQHNKEVEVVFSDGTTVKLLQNVAPLFDEQGRPRGCVGGFIDVTERRRAEQEREVLLQTLRENDRRKDEFLAMLAHELRNPLSAIGNASQILQLKIPADPDLKWSCDIIQRQTRHLSRLLDDLLDVSRITGGKVRLRRETVDLRDVIGRAMDSTRPMLEQKHQTLDIQLPPIALRIDADPARIEQVLVNLMSNAAKYSEEGRTITVVGVREHDEVIVRVKDQGVGIPPDVMAKVFELFAQAESTLDRSQGGLGIGLTIVKSLVELHGGTVAATSDGSGLGSEFVVRLPALDDDTAGSSASERATGARVACHRIVVVDDNVDANEGIARLLVTAGHQVERAYDGPSALDLVEAFRPRIVLLDIGLPGMDGYEVAALIRRRPYGRDMVVAAVTGYGQESDRLRALDAGFDHHIIKPVDVDGLLAVIEAVAPHEPASAADR